MNYKSLRDKSLFDFDSTTRDVIDGSPRRDALRIYELFISAMNRATSLYSRKYKAGDSNALKINLLLLSFNVRFSSKNGGLVPGFHDFKAIGGGYGIYGTGFKEHLGQGIKNLKRDHFKLSEYIAALMKDLTFMETGYLSQEDIDFNHYNRFIELDIKLKAWRSTSDEYGIVVEKCPLDRDDMRFHKEYADKIKHFRGAKYTDLTSCYYFIRMLVDPLVTIFEASEYGTNKLATRKEKNNPKHWVIEDIQEVFTKFCVFARGSKGAGLRWTKSQNPFLSSNGGWLTKNIPLIASGTDNKLWLDFETRIKKWEDQLTERKTLGVSRELNRNGDHKDKLGITMYHPSNVADKETLLPTPPNAAPAGDIMNPTYNINLNRIFNYYNEIINDMWCCLKDVSNKLDGDQSGDTFSKNFPYSNEVKTLKQYWHRLGSHDSQSDISKFPGRKDVISANDHIYRDPMHDRSNREMDSLFVQRNNYYKYNFLIGIQSEVNKERRRIDEHHVTSSGERYSFSNEQERGPLNFGADPELPKIEIDQDYIADYILFDYANYFLSVLQQSLDKYNKNITDQKDNWSNKIARGGYEYEGKHEFEHGAGEGRLNLWGEATLAASFHRLDGHHGVEGRRRVIYYSLYVTHIETIVKTTRILRDKLRANVKYELYMQAIKELIKCYGYTLGRLEKQNKTWGSASFFTILGQNLVQFKGDIIKTFQQDLKACNSDHQEQIFVTDRYARSRHKAVGECQRAIIDFWNDEISAGAFQYEHPLAQFPELTTKFKLRDLGLEESRPREQEYRRGRQGVY